MSDFTFSDFGNYISTLSYEQTLLAIKMLADSLQNRFQRKEKKNGIDIAIQEIENGQVETFDSFEDFKAAML